MMNFAVFALFVMGTADAQNITFNTTFSDFAVLQREPAKAAVYGMIPANSSASTSVTVTLTDSKTGKVAQTVQADVDVNKNQWKALFSPTDAGGDYTVEAASNNASQLPATIEHVTFGDVWYCSGQSNMWLPVRYTFDRNKSLAAIATGALDTVRVAAGDSQRSNVYPWLTAKQASAAVNLTTRTGGLFDFSAACWYFAQELTGLMAAKNKLQGRDGGGSAAVPVPIGVVDTAIGGSRIEEWTLNSTTAMCANVSQSPSNQMLYDKDVVPYLGMTVKGFLWYQGENNMHEAKGNSMKRVGYGCQMEAMVDLWRKVWSATPGTTDPQAPFGIVSLAASGSEGGPNMGTMRWAQTANYGMLPNKALPNTFLAHAYDLDDPWGDKTCYEYACCPNNYNFTRCNSSLHGQPHLCDQYCEVLMSTSVYMGGIHPRLKQPLGKRLATAAFSVVYNGSTPAGGPTISGCRYSSSSSSSSSSSPSSSLSTSSSSSKLTVTFSAAQMAGETVAVKDYNRSTSLQPVGGLSAFQVLTNSSFYCLESALRCINQSQTTCPSKEQEWYCTDNDDAMATATATAGHNHAYNLTGVPPRNPFETEWKTVPIDLAPSDPLSIVADLSSLNGSAVVAVRYAWGINCCKDGDPLQGIAYPCPAMACPVVSSKTQLPANPFMARIGAGGKCECPAPQECGN